MTIVEIEITDECGTAKGTLADWVSAIYSELSRDQKALVQASVRRRYSDRLRAPTDRNLSHG